MAGQDKWKLVEDLLAQAPGVAVFGMCDPGLDGGLDIVPVDASRGIVPLQRLDFLPKALHIRPDQAAAIREDAPAEEGDTIHKAVDAALAGVKEQTVIAEKVFDALAHDGELRLILAEEEKVIVEPDELEAAYDEAMRHVRPTYKPVT